MRTSQNRRLVSGFMIALLIATAGSLATPQSAFAQWEWCYSLAYACEAYCINACAGQGAQCIGIDVVCDWGLCIYQCSDPHPEPCCDSSCWFDPYCDCQGHPLCY
jgi:hypothetical protein